MRVVGRPRTWSFRARAAGVFRLQPNRPWTLCEAWQYDTSLEIARVFIMRLRLGLVPVVVRDVYVRGEGRIRGRMLDTFSIMDRSGDQVATGELVTYLNDAILMAPSMLLAPEATFSDVDHNSFQVMLTEKGKAYRRGFSSTRRGASRNSRRPTVMAAIPHNLRKWCKPAGQRLSRPGPSPMAVRWSAEPKPSGTFRVATSSTPTSGSRTSSSTSHRTHRCSRGRAMRVAAAKYGKACRPGRDSAKTAPPWS